MASRSKLDHDSRTRRQKALEAPKEPRRPKTHWDNVLEEMAWLSKDFESERRWKLAQAKKVATRASRDVNDQDTKGVKRVKEEELKLRRTALNISKDVKKFWTKIEKLVLYKHQLEVDDKRKKALDKQLEFLLGQTERYSSMLAENLIQSETMCESSSLYTTHGQHGILSKPCNEKYPKSSVLNTGSQTNGHAIDEDYDLRSSDEFEDDEHMLEEDEALITKQEREEELVALHNESSLPLDEVLERYVFQKGEHIDGTLGVVENGCLSEEPGLRSFKSNGVLPMSNSHYPDAENKKLTKLGNSGKNHILHECIDEHEDDDFELSDEDEKEGLDDETTLLEEEQLAKTDLENTENEILRLQRDNEIPLEVLLLKYKKDCEYSESLSSSASEDLQGSSESGHAEAKEHGDEISVNQDTYFHHENEDFVPNGICGEDIQGDNIIADAAAAARSAQPSGNTFLTTKVKTKFPFLLKYPLREYQHIGLDWLVTMYENRLNGILADEMGLGKTIMTISLLAHLACEKGIWGPHLIVVPTSVMLNWETEFLKWCPAFKILTYFGSAKERRIKRQGWMKFNYFHVCITTYRLVIQDAKVFKRKKWKYLILDEAHLIKNWKSQRWQTLLNFNSKRRILLTGTPLQNDLMELWSLMHFLMPQVFQSHQEFKDWFCNPISGMVEGQEKVNKAVVDRLHNVLRPFILRRLKRDVEKQLPVKHEHVIYCRLSRRQRNLYEDFIASSETQATLASANFFGMISVIMQLRKVCNHPDLFEGRPTLSSFDMSAIDLQLSSSVCTVLTPRPFSAVDLKSLGLVFTNLDLTMESWEGEEVHAISTPIPTEQRVNMVHKEGFLVDIGNKKTFPSNIFQEIQKALSNERFKEAEERAASISWWNNLMCKSKPIYGTGFRELVSLKHSVHDVYFHRYNHLSYDYSCKLADAIVSPVERFRKMSDEIESFMFAIPAARAPTPVCWCSKTGSPVFYSQYHKDLYSQSFSHLITPFYSAIVRRQVYFPDRRLIQFDCGKLQELSVLLRRLKSEGHRALIFTQMTKMLDILEFFINLYGYIYMRLDGSTPPETRQTLMQQFNTNPKIFLFILSTRSGGVGINLVGADTVIFYDSDWNPAMDQQAQDRCHRIGQTREVHIYRLISESTIEENILKKANQKRALDDLVIQGGGYNTEFFKKLDPMELFSNHRTSFHKGVIADKKSDHGDMALSSVDLEAALKNAEDEADYMALKKVEEEEAVDNQEFTEEAVAKLDEDEPINDEELRHGISAEDSFVNAKSDVAIIVSESRPINEGVAIAHVEDDDVDMLADVKQMAAAAASSGQALLSFENQLRPIDRYAIRFLELWNPLIEKAPLECHTDGIKKDEWELERIEKLKEEMEAQIDEDEEPLVYESWDADFATEVYKQQVEILAQHQLKEDMEREAREKEALECANMDSSWNDEFIAPPRKSKSKAKKAKFKSLKKEAFVSRSMHMREESSIEPMSLDDDLISDEMRTSSCTSSPCSTQEKKRPASDDDEHIRPKKSKKLRDTRPGQKVMHSRHFSTNQDELKPNDDGIVEFGYKHLNRNKIPGNLSIPMLPPKNVFTIKQEKLKKKGAFYSKDFSSDVWSTTEDAILCALVHEYGPNWSLSGDIMNGLTAGGSYRGRFHHPVHCSERFRDLFQKYIFPSCDATHEKAAGTSSAKTSLRVNEDNVRVLLGIASGLPDPEPLLQNHFSAVLFSTWRAVLNRGKIHSVKNGYHADQKIGSILNHDITIGKVPGRVEFTNLNQCEKLVAAALNAHENNLPKENRQPIINETGQSMVSKEQLDLTLELHEERADALLPLPTRFNVTIRDLDLVLSSEIRAEDENHIKSISQLRKECMRNACTSLIARESQGAAMISELQNSRKDKLHGLGIAKSSKSKSRSGKDHSDLLSMPTNSADELPCSISETGIFEFGGNYLIDVDSEGHLWASPGMLASEFAPDALLEFTDIG